MGILDGLDDVNWQDLSHAYGSAEDVPRQLRTLLSQDESEWDEAFTFFFQSVWHQGTVYSVTAHVIPFLVELLTVETVIHREGILYLLEALANGNSYGDPGSPQPPLRVPVLPAARWRICLKYALSPPSLRGRVRSLTS